MADKRRSLMMWLAPKLLIFALGVAAGYYVRDQRQGELESRYEQAVTELEALKRSGQEAIERGRRASEGLKAGAKAAADSTRAAVEEITGKSKDDGGR